MTLRIEKANGITTVILNRPEVRNAVDRETAGQLADAFREFDADPDARVGVLYGDHGTFCAGADLKAIAKGQSNRNELDGDGPMGPTRILLSKPVIAAISGYAVAGGLELALWCDLRVMAEDAYMGVFCRRFGVPLIDGGTVRLPRLVGLSHALDLILTGRKVEADEALRMGLCNRVVPAGQALQAALALAHTLTAFPQATLRADRASALAGEGLPLQQALLQEWAGGRECLAEALRGATRFATGEGRHGKF